MIKAIGLENVRLFEGRQWDFELSPLTVFCGVNSAGKSTLLKSLLLLRQSQKARELRLAGSQVDFGDYRSFVSGREIDRDAAIQIDIDFGLSTTQIDFLRSPNKRGGRDKRKPTATDVMKTGRFSSRFVLSATGEKHRASPPPAPESSSVQAGLKSAKFALSIEHEQLLSWDLAPAREPSDGVQYEISFPLAYLRKVGMLEYMNLDEFGKSATGRTTLDGFVPQAIIAKPKEKLRIEGAKDQWIGFPLPTHVQRAQWALEQTLQEVSYLGPLRSPAKRYYMAHLEVDESIDSAGEFLPYVLRDRGQTSVVNCSPRQPHEPETQTLSQALDHWLHYLRTGEYEQTTQAREISLDTTKQVLVQINLKSAVGSSAYAMADSGFGYSQVMPILVRGLLTPQNSTLIVEQPELHLNPSLQIRLAEFFISMIRAGKQVLLETHSEHLVNAIRVLSAEAEGTGLSDKCRIYFIDSEAGRPLVHDFSIRPDGSVPDWPRHFFGEAINLTGRLLRAQQKFRRPLLG